jgi:hypothetical protein
MNQEYRRLADLAAHCIEFVRGCCEAVDPEIAPLSAPVDDHLEVEAIGGNARRVDPMDQRWASGVGDHEVAFVFKAELAQLYEIRYLLGLRHVQAKVLVEGLKINVSRIIDLSSGE